MGSISKNFSYREFEKTSYSEFKYKNMIADYEVRDNIKELVETILQPLRDAWGGPLVITSGYRCEGLNEKVGGSATSVHPLGLAADLVPENRRITDNLIDFAIRWILENDIAFDQLIDERDRRGNHWLHIGLRNRAGEQRRQIKAMVKKY